MPGQTLEWLADRLEHGRLTLFTAHLGRTWPAWPRRWNCRVAALSCSWQLRDLYVRPPPAGSASPEPCWAPSRAAATAVGAIRLSVKTEPGNIAALQLYHSSGFLPVDDLQALALPLHDGA